MRWTAPRRVFPSPSGRRHERVRAVSRFLSAPVRRRVFRGARPAVWGAAASVLLAAGLACTSVFPGAEVFRLPDDDVRAPQLLFNPEEGLQRGYFPELQRYLEELPRQELLNSASQLALYGKMFLARGDYDRAWRLMERARDLEGRTSRRAEIEWALSQGAILWNDFRSAHDYAESAVRDGYGLVPGFVRFLAALVDVDVYAGRALGEAHSSDFD